jgi:hypothetical protein
MVRPRRVKGKALKQRDWYMQTKKFRRVQRNQPAPMPTKKRFDWWIIIWVVMAGAAMALLSLWLYNV